MSGMARRVGRRLSAGLLLLLLGGLPLLATAVSFDEHTRKLPLGPQLQFFEDIRGSATIADVSSAALDDSFRQANTAVLNAGYTRSAYWLRVDLDYRPQQAQGQKSWLLDLAYPPLDHVDLYVPDGQGGYQLASRSGDFWPFSQRQIKQSSFLFDLSLQPAQPLRVYLRVQTAGSLQTPLTLWAPTAYLEDLTAHTYLLGIIYGVMLVMLLYNLFIYLSVRDSSYLYYIFYIAAIGLYQATSNGVAAQYLWPNSPGIANAAPPFLLGATALCGSQFVRSFLHTRAFSRGLDLALKLVMACGLSLILLTLSIGYATPLKLAPYVALPFLLLCLTAGVSAWRRGLRVARYFLLAWSAFLIGGLIYTLMVLGYLPNMFLTLYASQIGAAMEVALLSLALADRINVMKEERGQILQESSRKLEGLNQQLAVSNQLKDEFLATVSHELRTPMNGVIGSLELMQTLEMSTELAQYQSIAATSARDMLQMVSDMLMLTELQAGRQYCGHAPFSLRGLIEHQRTQFAPRAAAKGLTFKVELNHRLPDTLEGDASKLGQCISYLLDNAIKFTREGGVSLQIEALQRSDSGLQLEIQVSDSGVGFDTPPDGKLYQQFLQLDGSLTREHGGLGIGLAICRQLIELLGGSLTHQSTLGRGSQCQLRLPLGLPNSQPRVATATALPQPVRPPGVALRTPAECRVLLVESQLIDQLLLRGMLLKLGYQVRCAENGAAALELLRKSPTDALLIDCQMPQADAFAICRALRKLPGCATLPVLAISQNAQGGERERCIAAGMSEVLSKPVKFDTLQDTLHDWLLCAPAG
ncbi:MAG: 7TM diverse intracellular signaling domain-containing protein [Pseudomonas sp.]|uniref:hybrid sensor histidine kinase/response regulator n=1 Tax=Pseudomonas sp. TaxID=306 RepID=UPI003BB49FA0